MFRRNTTLLLCFLSAAMGALVAGGAGGAIAAAVKKLLNGDKTIARHTLSGDRMRANTLHGAQIAENTLGTVPRAKRADNATHASSATIADTAKKATTATRATSAGTATTAQSADHAGSADNSDNSDKVNGLKVQKFNLTVPQQTGPSPVYTSGGLSISAGCANDGTPIGTMTSPNDSSSTGQANIGGGFQPLSQTGSGMQNLTQGADTGGGSLNYTQADGAVMTINYQFFQTIAGATTTCTMTGTVIGG